jgi:hypothetical protein
VRVDGEPNGRSDVGDDDREDDTDDTDDTDDGCVDSVGVGGNDAGTMVDDLSRALLINCPRYLGCVSQCLAFEGASLDYKHDTM